MPGQVRGYLYLVFLWVEGLGLRFECRVLILNSRNHYFDLATCSPEQYLGPFGLGLAVLHFGHQNPIRLQASGIAVDGNWSTAEQLGTHPVSSTCAANLDSEGLITR